MMTEALAKVLEAVATLAWPVLVAWLAYHLRDSVKKLVEQRDFHVEVGGFKLSTGSLAGQQKKQLDALRELDARVRKLEQPQGAVQAQEASTAAVPSPIRRVLWIDDEPRNNAFEIAELREADILVDAVKDLNEALEMSESHNYGIVITDLGRVVNGTYDATAGIETIRELSQQHTVVLFTSPGGLAKNRRAVEVAAPALATSSQAELLNYVIRQLS